jgi:WD40 repeat protein
MTVGQRADRGSLVNIYAFDKPQPVTSLSGHTSFVYSVSALPDGTGAISAGEDGTLRVWSSKSSGRFAQLTDQTPISSRPYHIRRIPFGPVPLCQQPMARPISHRHRRMEISASSPETRLSWHRLSRGKGGTRKSPIVSLTSAHRMTVLDARQTDEPGAKSVM